LHQKNSQEINRTEINLGAGVKQSAIDDVEGSTGDRADTKGGVGQVPPLFLRAFFAGIVLAGIRRLSGERLLTAFYWRTLLIDARRSSLLVKFGEKRFFLQRTAGPQQFQKGILPVGCGAAGLTWFLA
jgi:hypothetical protein